MKNPTKAFGILMLVVAGALLLWVGAAAGAPTYVAPKAEVAPVQVPSEITGDVPAGYVVRTLDVEGICCEGCGSKLYQKLVAADGVQAAAVSTALRVAQAVVPAEADPSALEQALSFDKYSATLRVVAQ